MQNINQLQVTLAAFAESAAVSNQQEDYLNGSPLKSRFGY